MNNNLRRIKSGFTLIEVLVSVSIFSIVMLVSTGAVFSIVEANKKAHTLKSVMTNLNFALESMARDIRVGSQFSCNGGGDCYQSPGTVFRYRTNQGAFVEYTLVVDADGIQRLQKEKLGLGGEELLITAREIYIESRRFYVIGTGTSAGGDNFQPKVLISIQGYAGVGTTRSSFNIQTTISQRAIDS